MYNQGPKTFEAGAEVKKARLVKLSSGQVVHNTETYTDDPIGVTLYGAGSGDLIAVDLIGHGKTMEMTAAGSISPGAKVYAAADGKVQALPETAGDYRRIGTALQAASGDGSIIEVLPFDFHSTTNVAA